MPRVGACIRADEAGGAFGAVAEGRAELVPGPRVHLRCSDCGASSWPLVLLPQTIYQQLGSYHRCMSTNSTGDRPQLVDIGVNFHAAQLVSLTDALLARAKAAGVTQILATGTSLASSRLARDLAKANPGVVFATAGVHPHGAKSCDRLRRSQRWQRN